MCGLKIRKRLWALPTLFKIVIVSGLIFFFTACDNSSSLLAKSVRVQTQSETKAPCSTASLDVVVGPYIPGGVVAASNQAPFDCFGWQSFIALNWAPPGYTSEFYFGKPGDTTHTWWQTWKNVHDTFQSNGAEPSPWGQPVLPPKACTGLADSATVFYAPDDIAQAAPLPKETGGKSLNWLADKESRLVWYQIVMNQAAFKTIVDKTQPLWNAAQQRAFYEASDKNFIKLKSGALYSPFSGVPAYDTDQHLGAMEVKVSWLQVEDITQAPWNTEYKTMQAYIYSPSTGQCRVGDFAMIGQHIIQKAYQQNTWVWATLEHVKNSPNLNDLPVSNDYLFYDPNCKPVTIPDACGGGETVCTLTPGLNPVTYPSYELTDYVIDPTDAICKPTPIQVARSNVIGNIAQQATQNVHAAIKQHYPDSIWLNYELVDVLWNQNGSGNGASVKNRTPPLPVGAQLRPKPDSQKVVNTTMETYAQDLTCTDCHTYGTISSTPPCGSKPQYETDFSHLYDDAACPSN